MNIYIYIPMNIVIWYINIGKISDRLIIDSLGSPSTTQQDLRHLLQGLVALQRLPTHLLLRWESSPGISWKYHLYLSIYLHYIYIYIYVVYIYIYVIYICYIYICYVCIYIYDWL